MQSLSSFSLLLLFLSGIHQFFCPTEAQIFMYSNCSTSANYTSGSVYEQNLNLSLTSLVANASLTGFTIADAGQNPDVVYGLVQCRGDISAKDCQACASIASASVTRNCPNQKEASIGYDNCMIRYSSRRFFTTVNSDLRFVLLNSKKATQPVLFNRWRENLLQNPSSDAATDPSRFAVGSANYTGADKIYALLQCTRDLSEESCLTCLEDIFYVAQKDGMKVGCQIYTVSCNLRYETYQFFESTIQLSPPEAASPPLLGPNSTTTTSSYGTNSKGKNSNKTIVTVVIPVAVTLMVIPLLIWACISWKKAKRQRGDYVHEEEGMESLSIGLGTLKVATKNFSNENKLGEGGFGPVYKGKLYDGREIAVKRLSSNSGQGLEEWKTEVVLVAKLLHRNLVDLLGFCLEDEKLLVYEYLPNGSLDKVLFGLCMDNPDERMQFCLDWERRYKIIVGIARGLLYLHEESQFRVIHRDLKASNILLDQDMNPKISDFGLAKLFCGSQTHGKTNRISGTFGYMAPEYAKSGSFSTKSDVYSFGILMLEIIAGRKNSSFRDMTNLQSYAWRNWANGTPLELMDPALDEKWPRHEALKCIHVGLLCVQEAAADRPRMSEVVMMLNSYSVTLPVPSRPAFFVSDEDYMPELVRQDSVVSECEVTITELHPRG